MATGKLTFDEGTTTNTATNTITEDAVTKHIPRSVLNKSDGTEIGTSTNPVQVSVANTGANTTAVKVDGSAVTQPVSGTLSITANSAVNEAQINGVTPLMGNGVTGTGSQRVTIASDNTAVAGMGAAATAAAVPSVAVYNGGQAATSLPTVSTNGNLAGFLLDKFGRQVVVPALRSLVGTQTTTISASTSETTIVTAGAAGVLDDIVLITVANTSAATTTRIDFRDDTAGTIIFSLFSPGGQTIGFAPPVPVPQTAAAKPWTAQCATSTTDIRIFVQYIKNQ